MNFLNSIVNAPPLIIGFFILAAVFLMAAIRHRENKNILKRFSREEIILMTYGVNYFGQESIDKKPLRSTGGLVMVKEGLYYHARFGDREFFLKGKNITAIGTTDTFNNKPLHQKVIVISFNNEAGKKDRLIIQIPHPAEWVKAIKITLMK